jgi:hypothetical protein
MTKLCFVLLSKITLLCIYGALSGCGGSGGSENTVSSQSQLSSTVSASRSSVSVAASSKAGASTANSAAVSSTKKSSATTSTSSSTGQAENIIFLKDYPAYSVSIINNCGKEITAAANSYRFFADYEVNLQNQTLLNATGWNHTTNGSATEWKTVSLAAAEYNNPSKGKVNGSCNNVDSLDMILLKKYANWDRQHSNGFEFHPPAQAVSFGQIDSIVLDIKINSAKTMLPTMSSLLNTYSSFVSEATLNQVDSGLVNIGLTFSDGVTIGASLKASTIIELDQNTLLDQWVRVKINMADLAFYSEVNYVRTNKTAAELSSTFIRSALFVAETHSGLVLRNHIMAWSDSVPETFKEMDLSFKKIEFVLK